VSGPSVKPSGTQKIGQLEIKIASESQKHDVLSWRSTPRRNSLARKILSPMKRPPEIYSMEVTSNGSSPNAEAGEVYMRRTSCTKLARGLLSPNASQNNLIITN